MSHVMPQVSLHRVISEGIYLLKQNPDVLDDIFQFYTCPEMEASYGTAYIQQIKKWFTDTKIPVVQAWSMDPQQAPQIAIKLAVEQEEESLAAIGDHFSDGDEQWDSNVGISPSTVNLDISIMTSKNGDQSLWLYYIVSYVLLKRKRQAEALGLQKHTFSATDYTRDSNKLADNIWVRYIRYRCTVQNFWDSEPFIDISDMEVDLAAESTTGDTSVDL
jgi:hypothetical protein